MVSYLHKKFIWWFHLCVWAIFVACWFFVFVDVVLGNRESANISFCNEVKIWFSRFHLEFFQRSCNQLLLIKVVGTTWSEFDLVRIRIIWNVYWAWFEVEFLWCILKYLRIMEIYLDPCLPKTSTVFQLAPMGADLS